MRLIARVRSLIRGARSPRQVDADMDAEMAFHIEQEALRLERERGLAPREARRQAQFAFGGVEKFKDEGRAARGLGWVNGVPLDLKLGVRMLLKYPGLTLVGGMAIAFAIAVGAAGFELVKQVVDPELRLPAGERLVGIRHWNGNSSFQIDPTLHDVSEWRESLRTIEELGAFRTVGRNLITQDGESRPVVVAEITAAALQAARVAPLLGRTLVEADELPGAPPVLVLGHRVWQRSFGGDRAVVGTAVRLGGSTTTIVGVMPERFTFPVAHEYWTPLRLNVLDYERANSPSLDVLGRLAPGFTLADAQAEVAAVGARMAAAYPETHERLRPEVMAYAESIYPLRLNFSFRTLLYSINLAFVLFLVLICANIATLVFARTAARESEIAVRNALGASRRRIVLQLFAEAFVLAGVGGTLGLIVAALGLRWGLGVFEQVTVALPFWMHASISPATMLYALALALIAAAVAGALPALKVTGKGVQAHLRTAAVGASGLQFGRTWSVAIVAQVALTVMIIPLVISGARDIANATAVPVAVATEPYLMARLALDQEPGSTFLSERRRDTSAGAEARARASYQRLAQLVAAEPTVAGVTFANLLPRMDHPQHAVLLVAAGSAADARRVSSAHVAPNYFEVLEAPVRAGRAFNASDAAPDASTIIVNQSFVDELLGGRSAVGQRVRYAGTDEDEPHASANEGDWFEIVGVVPDIGMTMGDPGEGAGIYHAAAPGVAGTSFLLVRVNGEPNAFARRLRALGAAADPALQLSTVQPLNDVPRDLLATYSFWFRVGMLTCAVALVLSLAGIYSIMAFTVARRTREIGIRVALGADRRRIIAPIFARAFAQIAGGVLLGVALLVMLSGGFRSWQQAAVVGVYVPIMMAVCMLACVVPTRRALRIQPTEAMRADG